MTGQIEIYAKIENFGGRHLEVNTKGSLIVPIATFVNQKVQRVFLPPSGVKALGIQLQEWLEEVRPSTGIALTLEESEVEVARLREGIGDLIHFYTDKQDHLTVVGEHSRQHLTRIEAKAQQRLVAGLLYRLHVLHDPSQGKEEANDYTK